MRGQRAWQTFYWRCMSGRWCAPGWLASTFSRPQGSSIRMEMTIYFTCCTDNRTANKVAATIHATIAVCLCLCPLKLYGDTDRCNLTGLPKQTAAALQQAECERWDSQSQERVASGRRGDGLRSCQGLQPCPKHERT